MAKPENDRQIDRGGGTDQAPPQTGNSGLLARVISVVERYVIDAQTIETNANILLQVVNEDLSSQKQRLGIIEARKIFLQQRLISLGNRLRAVGSMAVTTGRTRQRPY